MVAETVDMLRLPYRLREPFLSSTEMALFRVLQDMMGGRYLVWPKVGLNDVFYIVRPNENVHFFHKFFRKHVDFLLCDPQTTIPAFGVEIVKSVSKSETRASDQFMDELFTSAGLPLVRIPARDHYETSDLFLLLQQAVTKIGGTAWMRAESTSDSVPLCPVCGRMMVLRVHRTGPKAGTKYYGCIHNPHCPGLIEIC